LVSMVGRMLEDIKNVQKIKSKNNEGCQMNKS
jgi:hypothetical protein